MYVYLLGAQPTMGFAEGTIADSLRGEQPTKSTSQNENACAAATDWPHMVNIQTPPCLVDPQVETVHIGRNNAEHTTLASDSW